MTKCYECKYELSDCKGNKQDDCPNFAKKGAVNYPQRVRELETELKLNAELCEVFRKDNERLKDKYWVTLDENTILKEKLERLEAEKEKWRIDFTANAEAYDIQGEQLLGALEKIEGLETQLYNMQCGGKCDECDLKCLAWQNGYNAKGGNISFDSIQMLRRIVKEVEPEWIDKNCISCAWFNNLKGVGGYCAYHNNGTTAKGGCNKWAKECDTE